MSTFNFYIQTFNVFLMFFQYIFCTFAHVNI